MASSLPVRRNRIPMLTRLPNWLTSVLAARCIWSAKESSPTVVLASGRSDRAAIWQTHVKPGPTVFSEVAKFTKVCSYDRPGAVTITEQNSVVPSRSTSVPQPTTLKNGVADLHALLTATKIPGPYVLVGHSYAGLIVRLYASTYPN